GGVGAVGGLARLVAGRADSAARVVAGGKIQGEVGARAGRRGRGGRRRGRSGCRRRGPCDGGRGGRRRGRRGGCRGGGGRPGVSVDLEFPQRVTVRCPANGAVHAHVPPAAGDVPGLDTTGACGGGVD